MPRREASTVDFEAMPTFNEQFDFFKNQKALEGHFAPLLNLEKDYDGSTDLLSYYDVGADPKDLLLDQKSFSPDTVDDFKKWVDAEAKARKRKIHQDAASIGQAKARREEAAVRTPAEEGAKGMRSIVI